jgi:hypothetical protein
MNTIAWLAAAASGGLLMVATSAFAQTWTQTSAPITNWSSIACSADGSKLVAVIKGGPIYTSKDAGATWMATSAPSTNWTAVACSADGMKIVAAAAVYDGSQYVSGGPIYVSGDSGVSWTSTDAPSTNWAAVASSADGGQMVAVAGGKVVYVTSAPAGPIYRSMDSGATWTAAGEPNADWTSVAASADGTNLAATVYAGGGPSLLYTSTNSGATWVSTNAGFAYLVSVASSAEGRRLVAGTFDPFHPPGTGGAFAVFTSTNVGGTWRQAPAGGLGRGLVASSADGCRLVAAGGPNGFGRGGSISRSIDSGVTWTDDNSPATNWSSVASSADGNKLVAAVNGGGIWILQSTAAPRLSIAPADTNFVLSWTVPSLPFVLQENTDLHSTNWTDVTTPPTLNFANLVKQVTVPLPVGNRFYRLKSP